MFYDVFVSHAWEDKETFVRPLVEKLKNSHVEVWYDEFSLNVGDSLREAIDKGLTQSRFGIVLSPHFFSKMWPKTELDGLFTRQMSGSNSIILPVWHGVSKTEVEKFSPMLAGKVAANSAQGIDAVVSGLLRSIKPEQSPLVVAHDELIAWGIDPVPVISDEWWIDVVEASNRATPYGAQPVTEVWGRWTFPLLYPSSKGEERGIRFSCAALQMQWEKAAEEIPITQCTQPELVLDFIDQYPGLSDTCHDYPALLAEYAPQLTIRGFGGDFEEDFDELLKQRSNRERLAFRLDDFGKLTGYELAQRYIDGGSLFGPNIRYYEYFAYVVWLLSSNSRWLPAQIRDALVAGLKEFDYWVWLPTTAYSTKRHLTEDTHFSNPESEGVRQEIRSKVVDALNVLRIEDDAGLITEKIFTSGLTDTFKAKRSLQRSSHKTDEK